MEPQKFEAWAIVEIFGHNKFAGRVSEQTIGGCSFVRVDVPELPARKGRYNSELNARPAFTKLFGQGAIYSITPVSEEVVTAANGELDSNPISVYIPAMLAQPAIDSSTTDEDDDEDGPF